MTSKLIDRFPPYGTFDRLKISGTMLSVWKRCRFKWWLRYMCGIQPKKTKPKMDMGDYGHELLRAFYMGENVQEASQKYWDKRTKDMFEEEEALFKDIRSTIEAVIQRYLEQYAEQDNFRVIVAEEDAYSYIPRYDGTPSSVRTHAKIDLVAEEPAGLLFIEHKFTDDFAGREEDLPIDQQFDMYFWTVLNLFRDQGLKVPLAYGVLNMINPRLPSVPELLKNGKSLSKDKRIFTTEEVYLEAIKAHEFDPADYSEVLMDLRDRPRPFFKRIKVFRTPEQLERFEAELRDAVLDMINCRNIYRNANYLCKRDCPYHQLCVLDMKGGDVTEYIATQFKRRKKDAKESIKN